MKIIWKYVLPANFTVGGRTDHMEEMPAGNIVHVEITDTLQVVVWLQFDVGDDWDGKTPQLLKWFFRRIPTGSGIPSQYQHLQTFFSEGGFVWHLHAFAAAP